jgi:hypothetical protein
VPVFNATKTPVFDSKMSRSTTKQTGAGSRMPGSLAKPSFYREKMTIGRAMHTVNAALTTFKIG